MPKLFHPPEYMTTTAWAAGSGEKGGGCYSNITVRIKVSFLLCLIVFFPAPIFRLWGITREIQKNLCIVYIKRNRGEGVRGGRNISPTTPTWNVK